MSWDNFFSDFVRGAEVGGQMGLDIRQSQRKSQKLDDDLKTSAQNRTINLGNYKSKQRDDKQAFDFKAQNQARKVELQMRDDASDGAERNANRIAYSFSTSTPLQKFLVEDPKKLTQDQLKSQRAMKALYTNVAVDDVSNLMAKLNNSQSPESQAKLRASIQEKLVGIYQISRDASQALAKGFVKDNGMVGTGVTKAQFSAIEQPLQKLSAGFADQGMLLDAVRNDDGTIRLDFYDGNAGGKLAESQNFTLKDIANGDFFDVLSADRVTMDSRDELAQEKAGIAVSSAKSKVGLQKEQSIINKNNAEAANKKTNANKPRNISEYLEFTATNNPDLYEYYSGLDAGGTFVTTADKVASSDPQMPESQAAFIAAKAVELGASPARNKNTGEWGLRVKDSSQASGFRIIPVSEL